jgi:hypothetical protein
LQLFLTKDNFNSKVYDLQNKKTVLTERFNELNTTLKCIHRELDPAQRKFLPDIPKLDEELEFPEWVTEVGFTRFEALMVRFEALMVTKINTVMKGKRAVPVIKHYPMKIIGEWHLLETGWAPEPVCSTWRSENSDPSAVQPITSHCTD